MSDLPAMRELAAASDPVVKEIRERGTLILRPGAIQIDTPEEHDAACAEIAWIAGARKRLEERRLHFTLPLREGLDRLQSLFKTLDGPLAQADRAYSEAVRAYRKAREEERQAEEARLREEQDARRRVEREEAERTGRILLPEAPAEVAPEVPSVVRTEAGRVGGRRNWKWEVIEEGLVPREYLCINRAHVTEAVRLGRREIPGLRIWREETLVRHAHTGGKP